MYVYCKNIDCFWHSDIEPNKCTRGLIIIGENNQCEFLCLPVEKRANGLIQHQLNNSNIENELGSCCINCGEFISVEDDYCHNCGNGFNTI